MFSPPHEEIVEDEECETEKIPRQSELIETSETTEILIEGAVVGHCLVSAAVVRSWIAIHARRRRTRLGYKDAQH